MELTTSAAEIVRERIPEAFVRTYEQLGTEVVVVRPGRVADALRLLRDECGFDMLADLSAVDWLPREPRFDVNYHLYSLGRNARLRVKVQLDADEVVPSCVGVWRGADWQEREVFDLMGITFTGHPNLTRILMPDEWIGHPHRKDYPIGGVPVEYKVEPAYVGLGRVSDQGRPSMGGIPPRLARDRARRSPWTFSGPPATGVRHTGISELPLEDQPMEDEERHQ
jgi:NADH-quinone oxidoreductase subunit C